MADRTLLLRCECTYETIAIDINFDFEFPDENYLSISPYWNQGRYWKERFKAAWLILRGKEFYFGSAILKEKDVTTMADFLAPYRTPDV
jgi:hypothetical protein